MRDEIEELQKENIQLQNMSKGQPFASATSHIIVDIIKQ